MLLFSKCYLSSVAAIEEERHLLEAELFQVHKKSDISLHFCIFIRRIRAFYLRTDILLYMLNSYLKKKKLITQLRGNFFAITHKKTFVLN